MGIKAPLSKRVVPGAEELARRDAELNKREAILNEREETLKAQIREFHAQKQREREASDSAPQPQE